MKFWQWCAEDPRRQTDRHRDTPDHPHHVWFGSNWQDERATRWIVRWAPLTGELYAVNEEWDVRLVGHIPSRDQVQEAYEGVKQYQTRPGSVPLLTTLLEDAPAVWGPDLDPEAHDTLDIEL